MLEYFSKLGQLGTYDLYEGDTRDKDLRYRTLAQGSTLQGGGVGHPEPSGPEGRSDYTDLLTERAVEYVGRRHDRPELLTELRTAWESVAAGLLPYPAA